MYFSEQYYNYVLYFKFLLHTKNTLEKAFIKGS